MGEGRAERRLANRQAGSAQVPAGRDDHGVDFSGSPGGISSATHGEAELEDTLTALGHSIRMLKQEGEI